MRFETRIGIAIVVVAAMTLVIGSAGFTSTEADRQVSVNIVEDDDAYVGLVYDDPITVGLTETELSENGSVSKRYDNASMVSNQFTVDVNVSVVVVDEKNDPPETQFVYDDDASVGSSPRADRNEARVPVGASAVFDAEVDCDTTDLENEEGTIVVEYRAEGTGISATVTREVRVECNDATGEITSSTEET